MPTRIVDPRDFDGYREADSTGRPRAGQERGGAALFRGGFERVVAEAALVDEDELALQPPLRAVPGALFRAFGGAVVGPDLERPFVGADAARFSQLDVARIVVVRDFGRDRLE